jgi:hypothetical protein
MTWKSTAAASGLAIVGTWLASYAPVGGPRQQPSAVPTAAHTAVAAAAIQREADRLHDRLQQVTAYQTPARNPFRFGGRPAPTAPPREPVTTVAEIPPPLAPEAPALRMMLSGIAEDVVGDEMVRTAIISTPDNVHLVKIGEAVGDTYKVTAIAVDAVELVRLDDGSTVRLALRP